nr:phosphate ABC transporter substrate-binding protein PstS [uncultured Rhodopila sp.]
MARWRRTTASLVVTLAVACGITITDADALELKGAGDTLQADLFGAWIEQFATANPGTKIVYEPVGRNESIRLLSAGKVEFAASDSPMAGQQAELDGKGVLVVPITAGMVVIAYNIPGLEDPVRLSRKALAGVFNGTVTYWDDGGIAAANPGIRLPHHEIAIVADSAASGATLALNRYLSEIGGRSAGNALEPEWTADYMTAPGDEGVAQRIEISEYSIGYVAYSLAARLGLHSVLLENQAGQFVGASLETGSAALASTTLGSADGRSAIIDGPVKQGAYPIVTYNWLLMRSTYDDPSVADGLRLFVGWGWSQGLPSVTENRLLPLPGPIVDKAKIILQRLR